MQARDDRVSLTRAFEVELPQLSRCLALSVCYILSCGGFMDEIVDNIFAALEEC